MRSEEAQGAEKKILTQEDKNATVMIFDKNQSVKKRKFVLKALYIQKKCCFKYHSNRNNRLCKQTEKQCLFDKTFKSVGKLLLISFLLV